MQYYIITDGQQIGPIDEDLLPRFGLTPQSMVWRPGMSNWMRAGSVAELSRFFNTGGGNSYQRQQNFTQPAQNNQYNYGGNQYNGSNFSDRQPVRGQSHDNPMTLAVIATVIGFMFGCLGGILGIIAMVNANSSNNAARMGDFSTADRKASTSKTMSIISLVIGGLGLLSYLFSMFYID